MSIKKEMALTPADASPPSRPGRGLPAAAEGRGSITGLRPSLILTHTHSVDCEKDHQAIIGLIRLGDAILRIDRHGDLVRPRR